MTIDTIERWNRKRGVDFARANVALEGFVTPPELEERALRYIDGEISMNELLALSGLAPSKPP